jgi:hypothetical protein
MALTGYTLADLKRYARWATQSNRAKCTVQLACQTRVKLDEWRILAHRDGTTLLVLATCKNGHTGHYNIAL